MALQEHDLATRLKEAGSKLSQLPSSKDELLDLLEEVEFLLKKVEQCPPKPIEGALFPVMKALVSDSLMKNSDSDVQIIVAASLNEITRITAPDAPYEDDRMKEVFELIVASFDKLSLLSGRSYDKVVSIVETAARVKSCMLMLDLPCEKLIIQMFEQFLRNIRSDHPDSVFSSMETIMTIIIDESEEISSELLKVLLGSVRNENESASSKLGTKVYERSAEKLKPYFIKAIKSGQINKDDCGPLIDSISQSSSDDMDKNLVNDSAEQVVAKNPAAFATSPIEGVQSGTNNPSKASEDFKQIQSPVAKAETGPENEVKQVSKRRGRKPNSEDSDDGKEVFMKKYSSSLKGRSMANSSSSLSKTLETKTPVSEPVLITKDSEVGVDSVDKNDRPTSTPHSQGMRKGGRPKKDAHDGPRKPVVNKKGSEVRIDSEEKNDQLPSTSHGQGTKKVGRAKKDSPEGLGIKAKNSGKKEKEERSEQMKKVTRRKRDQDDEVFETPYGRKKYKEDIVGCRIKVWWPMDKAFYEGRVASYNSSTMKHRVSYDDGDVEVLNLMKETFEFIADEDDGEQPAKEPASKEASDETIADEDNGEELKEPETASEEASDEMDNELKNDAGEKISSIPSYDDTPNKDSNEASGRPLKYSGAKTEGKKRKTALV